MIRKPRARTLLLVVFLAIVVGQASGKIFDNTTKGGRALALGGAFTAGAGSDALFYNVAGLRTIKGLEACFLLQPSNMFEDLNTLTGGITLSLPSFSVGAYMNMLSLDEFFTETTVVAGFAADLPVLKSVFKRFSVGAAFRLYMMSKDFSLGTPGEKDDDQAISFDFGIQMQVSDSLVIGFSGLNLLAPKMSYYENVAGTGEKTDWEIRLGIKYNLLKEFALYLDYSFYPEVDSDVSIKGVHVGGEITFYGVFMLRFGLDEGDLTIGLGIAAKMIDINISVKSKGIMGLYYQTGLVVKL